MKRKRSGLGIFKQFFAVTTVVIFISFLLLGMAFTLLGISLWTNEKQTLLSNNVAHVAETTATLLEKSDTEIDKTDYALMIINTLNTLSSSIDADVFIVNLSGKVICCKESLNPEFSIYSGVCAIHSAYKINKTIIEDAQKPDGYIGISDLDGILPQYNFVVAEDIIVGGKAVGAVISTQPRLQGIMAYFNATAKTFAIASVFALAAAFTSVYILTYKFTRPLREMSVATKMYSDGDFSFRVKSKGNNELSDLAREFNSMADALSRLELTRRSFVANVSHELKTPMTTIGGFIDGILDGTIDKTDRDKYLRIVSDEVKRLSRLVTGMLNLSKIETGELKLNYKTFDLSEVIFTVTLSFEQIIQKKSIEISGLESMVNSIIFADEDMVSQVIYNLINNAVKFTPESGFILFIIPEEDDDFVIFKIRNSGPGIPSDELPHIFERFYKVDKSRSYDVNGSGLGLFIVKNIIELHKGRITCESVENEYTEFTVQLPRKTDEPN